MGMTALHVLCCNPNATVNTIKVLKDVYPNAASMRSVVDMTPLMMFLKCKAPALVYNGMYTGRQQQRQQQLVPPLHWLLEHGVRNDVLEIILRVFDDENELVSAFDIRDDVSNLLPFIISASRISIMLLIRFSVHVSEQTS